jgi:MEMO1 family protein
MGKKKAAYQGAWYPESAEECESHIKGYLKENNGIVKGNYTGCIVPHAGWYYSGSIACRTIASLADSFVKKGRDMDAVIIFGIHMNINDSSVILGSGSWETPFGDLNIHKDLGRIIIENTLAQRVNILEKTHKSFPEENTIELQLPFIKIFFPDTLIVPIGVPPNQDALTIGSTVFDSARDLGLNIAAIGSTDLTHYGQPYGFTPVGTGEKAYEWVRDKNDAKAVKVMSSMDGEEIVRTGNVKHNMCCPGAAASAAVLSKLLGATKGLEVEYASSYSQSPGDSFVGYTGILYSV